MRTNRKEFPDFVKKARLKKGETVAAFRKKQTIMKWKDKRDVVLIRTFHDDSMENVTTRQGVIQKPSVVLDYNKNVGSGQEWPTSKLQVGSRTSKEVPPKDVLLPPQCGLSECIHHIQEEEWKHL